ncbi:MAG: peptide/nickel transport system permease protein [Rhodospirillaceae bacterium]|nr:peptide/nickel transport system permease protein [Rhodospirillaceae bacterium]
MVRYLINRLGQAVVLLLGVSVIGFALMHLAPGGPLAVYTLNPTVTAQDIERVKHQLGLDQPVYVQYFKWAEGLATGHWGYSFFGGRPVSTIVLERIPATLELMGSSLALALIIGVALGILAAVRRNSMFDYATATAAMIALSLPTFWFGLLGIYVFAQTLGWLPAGGIESTGGGGLVDRLHHLVLPMLVLALVLVAQWSRYTRSAMIEILDQDYMRTARAKGLSPTRVLLGHGLRAALVPLVTLAGLQLPLLVGGALVTETVFSWPGMGLLFVNALGTRDYPVLMAILMVGALVVVLGNLLADVIAALIDPRIKLTHV